MTAIVGILNTQGMALAADSAVTITSGAGVQKVYNKGNKIFALSKTHRVGVAIYNGSSFLGIPWEILLKMYRSSIVQEFNTVQEYQADFLGFLNQNLHRITPASKNNSFFNFASTVYNEVLRYIDDAFDSAAFSGLAPTDQVAQAPPLIESALLQYRNTIDNYPKNPNNAAITPAIFSGEYSTQIAELVAAVNQKIDEEYPGVTLTGPAITLIEEALYISTQLRYIFENNSGLVFFGFGKEELFPSSHLVTVGSLIGTTIRYEVAPPVVISAGTLESNIIPYAQSDVTLSVLTGIDPHYQQEIGASIRAAFTQAAEEVQTHITNKAEGTAIANVINNIATPLIDKLNNYKQTVITQPLLNMLAFMGIEDMAELAESLVNVTSLKRKFTEGFESVGGPVDVVVVTKGDGIVWMKRKQYFTESLNKNL